MGLIHRVQVRSGVSVSGGVTWMVLNAEVRIPSVRTTLSTTKPQYAIFKHKTNKLNTRNALSELSPPQPFSAPYQPHKQRD